MTFSQRFHLRVRAQQLEDLLDVDAGAVVAEAIVAEDGAQRENRADSPPWNVLFETAEQFDQVDRASRLMDAESITVFCRGVLLKRAEEILAEKSRGRYPITKIPASKVAEKKRDP
jgi:hypothetical protein